MIGRGFVRSGYLPGVRPFHPLWLGTVPYADAFALQRALHAARVEDAVDDVLLLLEHPPTITVSHTGRGRENLVAGAQLLAERGVVIEETDRGGNVTFHGPGQLVGYPIVKMLEGEQDLHAYLRRIEEVLIGMGEAFGVATDRVKGRTGTWLTDERGWGTAKLAAIGVKASRWTTLHGFAMNVHTDLSFFDLIVPCGISDAGVTSLAAELEHPPTLEAVADVAAARFAEVFGRVASPPTERVRMLCGSHGVDPHAIEV